MLEWIRKQESGSGRPTRDPAAAGALLAELRGAEPDAALADLTGWLESTRNESDSDPKLRAEILSLIDDAGAAHVAALLTQYLAHQAAKPLARESAWKSAYNYVCRLAPALGECAGGLVRAAGRDADTLALGASAAVRTLRACRLLAKLCLVHYFSVPPKLWRLAYWLHAKVERAGCATTTVSLHAHKTATTASHELLRLLMLQVSAPEMMAPEQIEVTDRVIDQIGAEFTLRPRGIADNPFYFDPGGELPPRRASETQHSPSADARSFGPGIGFDALERIHKQLLTARLADIKVFGKDIAPQVQLTAVRHLLMFWRAKCPYSPPAHSQAAGSLQIVHRYGQIWQHLFHAGSAGGGLSLQEDDEEEAQPPETWALRDAGGDELGADISQASNGWAKCGELVGISSHRGSKCWLGMIRRMHAESAGKLHTDIAVLSREPRALSLRALLARGEDGAFTEASSRQFAFNGVRAIILTDGSGGAQTSTLLLPSENWKEGRIYEATIGDAPRYLRGLQALRRGEDYVRATFEWVAGP